METKELTIKRMVYELNSTKIDLTFFYAITLYPANITLQGKLTQEVVIHLKELGCEFIICPVNNFYLCNYNVFTITLTF